MNVFESMFPESPAYKGIWQTIYLEPIIGSKERIAIVVVAIGEDRQYKALQSLRPELLECLYGDQAQNMQNMINWALETITAELDRNGKLIEWVPPFAGLEAGTPHKAADEDINGILRQAIRSSASLSELALDADRDNSSDEDSQTKRKSDQWATSIAEELKNIEPHLLSGFRKKIQVGSTNVKTTYGFYSEEYVSNFGLLTPIRLSSSLTTVKAKILDLEALKKSQASMLKPESLEIIIGTPSFEDPTLTKKNIDSVKDSIKMLEDYSAKEGITVFQATSARTAANRIAEKAA